MSPVRATCLLALFTLFASGCASSLGPTSPPMSENQSASGLTSVAGDSGSTPAHSLTHHLWAYHRFSVAPGAPEGPKITKIPVRLAATHWNVLKFLEQGPCTNCVTIDNVTPSGTGTLLVDVRIRHPFDVPNFTGFDVRGIVIFSGSHYFPECGLTASDRYVGEGELVNADGYTTLYNASTEGCGPGGFQGYTKGRFATDTAPESLINGYKRHISPGAANTRNAFYAGDSLVEIYELDMPDGPFIFGYAVDASWAPPAHKPVEHPMTDFPPEANCPEPWKADVVYSPIGQGLTDHGGSANLCIDVHDWQGKDSHHEPLIECPELFSGTVNAVWSEDGPDYTRFLATIANEELVAVGEYKCLISIEDNENATAPDWLDLTAYQIETLEVVEYVAVPPIAVAGVDPNPALVCQNIHFFDDGSYDADGTIVSWEWDWDNDGTYDESGSDVYHSWDTPGTYYVQFRVTDNDDATDELDAPLEIVVENAIPKAVVSASTLSPFLGEEVEFDGSFSFDNDCGGDSIVEWEWDWDNDGTYDETGSTASHDFGPAGTYYVQLRVTDDEGATDTLDDPLEIWVVRGWARTWGGEGWDTSYAVSADSFGDVYVTGSFSGVVDFDPGKGVAIGESIGLIDVFLAKFSDMGELLWVRTWGGIENDYGWAIALGGDQNVYVAGGFVGEVNFDPDGTEVHTSLGSYDAFISKFDSGGDFLWVRVWGSGGWDEARAIAIYQDITDRIYVTGYFDLEVDFDPGTGTDTHTSMGLRDVNLTGSDADGVYRGTLTWGGPEEDEGYGVSVDPLGAILVTGSYRATVDFDPEPDYDYRTSNGEEDAFVSKFDSSIRLWTRTWGGTSHDRGRSVYANPMFNEVYAAGFFYDSVDFNPLTGPDVHVSNGSSDAFLTKLNTNGAYTWTKTWGGTEPDAASCVSGDHTGDIVCVTGGFEGTVDFDPSSGICEHTSYSGGSDVFLSMFNFAGDFNWVSTWGGSSIDYGFGVDFDSLNNIYSAGYFSEIVDFNTGPGADMHISLGLTDAYLVRYPFGGQW